MSTIPREAIEATAGPAPKRAPVPPDIPACEEATPYGIKALREETEAVALAPNDTRHPTLNRAAFRLGQLIVAGHLRREAVEAALYLACERNGMLGEGREVEVQRTIEDGITAGMESPRVSAPEPASAPREYPSAAVAPRKLDEVVSAFRRWQYLPDERPLLVVLGAYIANLMEGDPVWLLVVGESGRGKTEMVSTLAGLPDVYSASTLTEASLLSGTPKREKAKESRGGLLRQIGEFGILLCKDFTSVLSMHRDARAGVLAALREVYDGSYTRHVGTDGGRSLAWQGRIGFVGGVTPVIDNAHGVMSIMGERFLMVRLPEADERALSRCALAHTRNPKAMRAELAEAVTGLVEGVDPDADAPELTADETERLIDLAAYVARARSPVIRDGYRREIELIVGAEAPTRIAIVLARLLGGIRALGADDRRAWSAVYLAGMDSIPKLRRMTLDLLGDANTWTTKDVATRLGHPTITVRRTLEDLAAYDMLARTSEGTGPKGDEWRMTARCAELRRSFLSSVSETSGDREGE